MSGEPADMPIRLRLQEQEMAALKNERTMYERFVSAPPIVRRAVIAMFDFGRGAPPPKRTWTRWATISATSSRICPTW